MLRKISLITMICVTGLLMGCVTPPPSPIIVDRGPTLLSLGIDPRDYGELGKRIHDSLAVDEDVRSKVVVLGPVELAFDGPYRFDPRTLQDRIASAALKAKVFKVNSALEAFRGTNCTHERVKIQRLEYEKRTTDDPEDQLTFGKLAKVDCMLCGRLTSLTARQGQHSEVMFTLTLQLMDVRTGLQVWSDVFDITKSTR